MDFDPIPFFDELTDSDKEFLKKKVKKNNRNKETREFFRWGIYESLASALEDTKNTLPSWEEIQARLKIKHQETL